MLDTLPLDIQEKIATLPTVSFEDTEAFQAILLSKDFEDIFNYYITNYSNEKILMQSEVNQKISLYLTLTSQSTDILDNINNLLYIRPVPTIEEFLDNNFYMGLQSGTLYPYWRKKLCEIFAPDSVIKRVLWSGATGSGKGVVVNEVIPTPSGYTKVKDLKVNDYLWGRNGKPTKILKIFDRGVQPIYKVKFDDNTVVTCDGDHLWEIIDYTKHKTTIRNTKWLATHKLRKKPGKDGSGSLFKYGIPYCQPVEYSEKEYSIHPYLLGVLLGDGCFSQKIKIINHINDIEIVNKCASLLPENYTLTAFESGKDVYQYHIVRKNKSGDSYRKYIKLLGLLGHTCNLKFIPEEYKLGSVEQRLELLRGLMDTDGSITVKKSKNSPNTIQFGTVSEQLAKDVAEIVRSLGGRAKITIQDRRQKKDSCNFIEYAVIIWLNLNPFSLKRKADLFKPRLIKKKIISVEKAGEDKTRCFVVDAKDHLFLCNDYIVTHNTVTARKAVIYSLYKLLCLRYPRAVLNVEPSSTLAVFILSVTQKNAYQTNFEPFITILNNMPCFQRVRNLKAFENFDISNPRCPIPFFVDKSNLTINFINNVILTIGSQISNTVGYDIVISAADEINEKSVEEGMELLNSIDGRLDSRFRGSNYTFQHVMSSARSTLSVTKLYANKWKNDPNFLYLHPMRFEVKQGQDFVGDGSTFPILIGNGTIPSKIITDVGELKAIENNEYTPPFGCEVVNVPTIYKNQFEADLTQQIQDILGIDTSENSYLFGDTSLIEDETLIPELHYELNLHEDIKLLNLLPPELFKLDPFDNKIKLARYPNAPRYVHCDFSTAGDQCDTGLCMLHKEWKLNEITKQKEIIYVVDFIIYITAKNKVDLDAIKNFFMELVTERSVIINSISADQYQSAVILNDWEKSKKFKNVQKISVDIKPDAYTSAASLVESGKVKIGKCDKLKKELECLIIKDNKIKRGNNNVLKDGADALAGSLYTAQLDYNFPAIYEYRNTNTNSIITEYTELIDNNTQILVDL